jgi:hypothetical protein
MDEVFKRRNNNIKKQKTKNWSAYVTKHSFALQSEERNSRSF